MKPNAKHDFPQFIHHVLMPDRHPRPDWLRDQATFDAWLAGISDAARPVALDVLRQFGAIDQQDQLVVPAGESGIGVGPAPWSYEPCRQT